MIKRIPMRAFLDAHPGVLLGVDYARGAKVNNLPVRVMVELRERRWRQKHKRWEWTGRIVKCSPALTDKYLGADLWISPEDMVAVVA